VKLPFVLFTLLLASVAQGAVTPVEDAAPIAGFHNGLFYLKDKKDIFRLYVQGRVHLDAVGWIGPGITSLDANNALRPTLFVRRARPELGGEFFLHWQWQLGIDLATSTDNQTGKTDALNCGVGAAGALNCTPQTTPVEAPIQKPAPTDAFINFGPSSWFNLQVGQFYLPFTMENRISDNTTPFLERSVVVRNIGAPLTRDIGVMAWGESPNGRLYYAVGIFNGDGPNRPNQDARFDYAGRVVGRLSRIGAQLGVSARWGSRDDKLVGYDAPALTTQGGFAFWRPTYKDSQGQLVHIIPSSDQLGVGLDMYLPIGPVDIAAELVYAASGTREAVDGFQLAGPSARTGALTGYGYYVEGGIWLLGSRDIIGFPSHAKPLHLDLKALPKPAQHGVELLGKVERLALAYHGASRSGASDPLTPSGNIEVLGATVGLNYWATRHLRVAINYSYYVFPGSEPVTPSTPGGPVQGPGQRAMAPAQMLARGEDDPARDHGHDLHEVSLRFGVQF
jgi:hypothetical protein